jgi:hypothetical protein
MKNKFSFSLFTIVLLMSLLTSCSKDSQLAPTSEVTTSNISSKPGFPVDKPGIVMGRLNPASVKAWIMLYDQFSPNMYGPFYPDLNTGAFRITNLPAGSYKLVIYFSVIDIASDLPSTHPPISLEVTISPNTITDLGTINL